jgi:hypothetical protein
LVSYWGPTAIDNDLAVDWAKRIGLVTLMDAAARKIAATVGAIVRLIAMIDTPEKKVSVRIDFLPRSTLSIFIHTLKLRCPSTSLSRGSFRFLILRDQAARLRCCTFTPRGK